MPPTNVALPPAAAAAEPPPCLPCRTQATRKWTYLELARYEFGRAGERALQLAIVVNNAGSMVRGARPQSARAALPLAHPPAAGPNAAPCPSPPFHQSPASQVRSL